MEISEREVLAGAYRDFNARRIDAVLERMHPNVEWANGMEGGHVHGREEVRDYWTRQWKILDPHVEPLRIDRDAAGRMIVEVHQVVRDLDGKVLVDTIVYHAYRIAGGLIERMDIQNSPAADQATIAG
ncbi:MAG: nuclear transport factor 2 family protein [Terracidiphilus sp.]